MMTMVGVLLLAPGFGSKFRFFDPETDPLCSSDKDDEDSNGRERRDDRRDERKSKERSSKDKVSTQQISFCSTQSV